MQLSHDTIEALADAAATSGLATPEKRKLLLNRLPASLVRTLARHSSDSDQIESDLFDLNQRPALKGKPPLLLWLRGAVRHARHTHELPVFEAALAQLTVAAPKRPKLARPSVHLRPKPGQQIEAATAQRPALVYIPAGAFWMGNPSDGTEDDDDDDDDETPRHRVILTQPFALMTTPITQAQYYQVVGTLPSHFTGDDRPVENVSWWDAVTFANALSTLEGLRPYYHIEGDAVSWDHAAPGYRLPTEAEWEYACQAGTTELRYGALDAIAWFEENSNQKTQPVAQKQTNAWGVHDMLGNVWEWCWDWHGDYPSGSSQDPPGLSTGRWRVRRGCGYWSSADECRSAKRGGAIPDYRCRNLGFRLVISSPAPLIGC